MADFTLTSLRGGQNSEDPPHSLPDDQCVMARNVEFIRSTLGERRRGSVAIDLAGSGIEGADRVTFLYRHLPSDDQTESELWALAIANTAPVLVRKANTWSAVTIPDSLDVAHEYEVVGQTLHAKLFLAFKSGVDRLHVWDGTVLRRVGLAEPNVAPTAVNSGSGSFTGTRYYRVRFTARTDGRTVRRSEPSPVLEFTPSGLGAGVNVTRPSLVDEAEEVPTDWELEASTDSVTFYRIASGNVATTVLPDNYLQGNYASDGILSEQSGDYELVPSGRFLVADEDRLVIGGSFENPALASRVMWTPVFNDPGAGNDERIPVATDQYLDLDGFEGGPLTGLSNPTNGYIFAFKQSHIYKLIRTGIRAKAYDAICLTKKRGALPGSIVEAPDAQGRPALYFWDPTVGPCVLGPNGLQTCGGDILDVVRTVNTNAEDVVCRGVYYPDARQVHWWVATGSNNTPTLRVVLHTNQTRQGHDGTRRGWAVWDGNSARAVAVCLYSDNVDSGEARNRNLRPFIGVEGDGLIQRTDMGDTDNGAAYVAHIATKPYTSVGILHQFSVMNGVALAKAAPNTTVDIVVSRDYGKQTKTVTADLTPEAGETHVIVPLDNLSFAELRTVQIEIKDTAEPAHWEMNQVAFRPSPGQRS